MADAFNLERFVAAQDSGGTYEQALSELQLGKKTGHWMWFIFPQLAGLGNSEMSQRYAIGSLEEARAYLEHSVLGPRLLECAQALTDFADRTAEEILGAIDARKLHSSMTLFLRAAPGETVFKAVLAQFFDGLPDEATDSLLRSDEE
ncbi:DUF1810 domain-containing protein [Arthrobacter sp. CDRTa11]|uniref:DUF1810 domain-containing protein n=1 Tax=Arthrobacter sp. CDRTa11 TaxID=2651199 RepID=UPI002265B266|nr:DUF1810 domain-containing protein [Arthrobacter sp. CDRTa11]UZX03596.1 DUF1810 domain-containing protein [Arthrobacter sp. CDRTa11]